MSNIIVFHCWKTDCAPCKHIKPAVEDLKEEFPAPLYEWNSINVDTDSIRTLKMGVRQVPCLVVYKDGKEVGRHTGTQMIGYYQLLRKAGKA
jgi:thioredoxin 1